MAAARSNGTPLTARSTPLARHLSRSTLLNFLVRSNRLTLVILLPLLVCSILSGCGREKRVSCPASSGGFRGYLTAAKKPIYGQVTVESANPGGGPAVYASQGADAWGWYSIGLPDGLYTVQITTHGPIFYVGPDGPVPDRASARIFAVENGSWFREDVRAGSLTLHLSLQSWESPWQIDADLRGAESWLQPPPGISTDTDGIGFRFSPLLPGRYKAFIHLYSGTTEIRFWLPGTYDEPEAASIATDEGETTVPFVIGEPGYLSGTMNGATRELGLGAVVTMTTESDSATIGFAAAIHQTFRLAIVAPVRAKLKVGEGVDRWVGGRGFADATIFDLRPGLTAPVTITDSGIEGSIDRAYGLLDRIGVTVCNPSGSSIGSTIVTGTAGEFNIGNLSPGTYTLFIGDGPTWASQWYGEADSAASATPVVISQVGEVAHAEVHLVDGGGISGRIESAGGTGIADATVTARMVGVDNRQYRAITDADGAYHIRYVPRGDFHVEATLTNDAEVWYPGVLDPDSAAIISIRNFATVDGIDIRDPR